MQAAKETLEQFTQACQCARPGGRGRHRGVSDYELDGEYGGNEPTWGYYAIRGIGGFGVLALVYIVATAFVALPQPWERYFEFPGVQPSRSVHSVVADTEADSGMHFDCNVGFVAWKTLWSLTQKAWCCRYKGIGCPPDEGYDCEEHQSSWETWETDKKHFCCGYDMEGCAGMVSQAIPPGQDCAYQLEDWEASWSPAKKLYCCKTHQFRCDAVPEQSHACSVSCSYGGVDATCQERVDWLLAHPRPSGLLGVPGACQQAHDLVSKDCDTCAPCTPEDSGCA